MPRWLYVLLTVAAALCVASVAVGAPWTQRLGLPGVVLAAVAVVALVGPPAHGWCRSRRSRP